MHYLAPGCTKTYDRQYSPTSLTIRHVLRLMALAENESEDWCWRNGGVSFEEPPVGPGIVCRSPEVDTLDRVVYLPDADVFQVITDGQFYSTRSLHQHAESWIGVVGIAVGVGMMAYIGGAPLLARLRSVVEKRLVVGRL